MRRRGAQFAVLAVHILVFKSQPLSALLYTEGKGNQNTHVAIGKVIAVLQLVISVYKVSELRATIQ
jgi:hypothetical protein